MYKKFYGALDAAEYASKLADEWLSDSGGIWDSETLTGVFELSDEENPLDEDDTEIYFVVDEYGAVGFTGNNGKTVEWYVKPTRPGHNVQPDFSEQSVRFCLNCGAKADPDAVFCSQCGQRLR